LEDERALAFVSANRTPWWAWAWPVAAWLLLGLHLIVPSNVVTTSLEAVALIATVFAAVRRSMVSRRRTKWRRRAQCF